MPPPLPFVVAAIEAAMLDIALAMERTEDAVAKTAASSAYRRLGELIR